MMSSGLQPPGRLNQLGMLSVYRSLVPGVSPFAEALFFCRHLPGKRSARIMALSGVRNRVISSFSDPEPTKEARPGTYVRTKRSAHTNFGARKTLNRPEPSMPKLKCLEEPPLEEPSK